MKRSFVLVLFALVACSNISRDQPDASSTDTLPSDGSVDTPDPPLLPPPRSQEVVNAGGRLTGTTYTLDVQIGHGVQQSKATSPTYTFEGNAAVKP